MDPILNRSLSKILTNYAETGLFTHGHCLSGSIATGEIFADVLLSPDGANVFDLASLTKAICTAPLTYQLMLDLHLDPDKATLEQLFKEWPCGLKNHFKPLQVKQLLRHESGLPAWRNFWICRLGPGKLALTLEERSSVIIAKFNQLAINELSNHPVYSDLGFILLGLALETHFEKSLGTLFNSFVTPFIDTKEVIGYPEHIKPGVAIIPTAYCPLRERLLQGEVHDENSASLGGQTGHAGVFGNVYGLAAFLGGVFSDPLGRKFLEMNANQIITKTPSGKPNEALFGWRQGNDRSACGYASGKGMGHLGFTGTAFWVDWDKKRFAILLTNRVISGRVNRAIGDLRSSVFAALN